MNFKPMTLLGVFGLLAACGGGTSDSGGGAGGGATFEDVLSDFSASSVLDEIDSDETDSVSFADLQLAGSASYTGQSLIFLVDDFNEFDETPAVEIESLDDLPTPSLAGEVNLQTTFSGDAGSVEGSFENFVDRDGNVKSGALTLADGEIGDFFGTSALAATFAGNLSGAGLGSRGYEGELLGFFTPEGGVVGIGAESLEDDVNDDASFALVFVAEE